MKYIMLRKSKFYFIFDASSDAQVKENSRAFPYYSHFRPIRGRYVTLRKFLVLEKIKLPKAVFALSYKLYIG